MATRILGIYNESRHGGNWERQTMKAVLIVLCGVCAFQGNLALGNSSQIQTQTITQSGNVTVKAMQVAAQQKSTAAQIQKTQG